MRLPGADAGAGTLQRDMGPSRHVRKLAREVADVAASEFSVLIIGETGVGKEIVAQALRHQSRRHSRPLVVVDCGAIPESLMESELFGHERGAFTGADRRRSGLFQLADGGTLFLDEISNLALPLQAKLLRAMESGEVTPLGGGGARRVDLRFIAAANEDLAAGVRAGTFRKDLYFRLAQCTIRAPALRERPEDIPHLAGRFLREAAKELQKPAAGFAPSVLKLFTQYSWPGNVRELRNIVRQAVLATAGSEIQLEVAQKLLSVTMEKPVFPARPEARVDLAGASLREVGSAAVREAECAAIRAALKASGGNKAQAARQLRTDYKTLHLKMRRYGICAHDFAPRS